MAQKVVVQLVDDLDGTVAQDISTIGFSLDGVDYEIDLTDNNAEKLRMTVADYVAAARRTGGRRTKLVKGKVTPIASREQVKAVRDWARKNGFGISDRGRVPGNVIDAFEAAHQGKNGKK
jgi:hypothetical protein